MNRWSRAAVLLCLSSLFTGCGGGGGGFSPPVYLPPPNELIIGVAGDFHVGDEIRMLAVFTDAHSKPVPNFFQNHAYTWDGGGLTYIKDERPFYEDHTMYGRFRATATGTYMVRLTVHETPSADSPILDQATYPVYVW